MLLYVTKKCSGSEVGRLGDDEEAIMTAVPSLPKSLCKAGDCLPVESKSHWLCLRKSRSAPHQAVPKQDPRKKARATPGRSSTSTRSNLPNKAAMGPLWAGVRSTMKLAFACRRGTLVLATKMWVESGHQTGSYSNISTAFGALLQISF